MTDVLESIILHDNSRAHTADAVWALTIVDIGISNMLTHNESV
jgi:hypothetical protein